jgi:hypothetical protein
VVKTNRVWTLLKAGIIGGSLLFSLASEAVCQQQVNTAMNQGTPLFPAYRLLAEIDLLLSCSFAG